MAFRCAAAIALLLAALACAPHLPPDPLPGFPRLVLWAWERPTDLSFLVPRATGVAYLAATVTLVDGGLQIHPRRQPLLMPPGTPLIGVVRIESRTARLPPITAVAPAVLAPFSPGTVRALQIDFDARASERAWYRDLLQCLRRTAPPTLPVEITALVSWCQHDDWIHILPVAEAVPMFFRMGIDPHSAREELREPLCRSSIGIATDEFYVHVPPVRRVFVFDASPWTESRYRAILNASKRWFPDR